MFGLWSKDKPYVNLTECVDISSMDYQECCMGIAKSGLQLSMLPKSTAPYYTTKKGWMRDIIPSTPEEIELYKDANKWRLYCKVYYESITPSYNIPITEKIVDVQVQQGGGTFRKRELGGYTEYAKHFPSVVKFLENEAYNYFSDWGRVLIYIQDHYHPLVEHTDNYDHDFTKPANQQADQTFLWINFLENRKMYIVDDTDLTNYKKIYVKGKVVWFNAMDIHGGDPLEHFSWSLRIDGIFKDEFKEIIRRKVREQ